MTCDETELDRLVQRLAAKTDDDKCLEVQDGWVLQELPEKAAPAVPRRRNRSLLWPATALLGLAVGAGGLGLGLHLWSQGRPSSVSFEPLTVGELPKAPKVEQLPAATAARRLVVERQRPLPAAPKKEKGEVKPARTFETKAVKSVPADEWVNPEALLELADTTKTIEPAPSKPTLAGKKSKPELARVPTPPPAPKETAASTGKVTPAETSDKESTLPAALTSAALHRGFAAVKSKVVFCAGLEPEATVAAVTVVINGAGQIEDVQVEGSLSDRKDFAGCITRAVSQAKFPAFSGAAQTVSYPFSLKSS